MEEDHVFHACLGKKQLEEEEEEKEVLPLP